MDGSGYKHRRVNWPLGHECTENTRTWPSVWPAVWQRVFGALPVVAVACCWKIEISVDASLAPALGRAMDYYSACRSRTRRPMDVPACLRVAGEVHGAELEASRVYSGLHPDPRRTSAGAEWVGSTNGMGQAGTVRYGTTARDIVDGIRSLGSVVCQAVDATTYLLRT